jgi:hypothetical protein
MAQNSLTDLVALINQQANSQEILAECLSKVQALIHVALDDNFLDYENFIINDYLWALSDFIEQAKLLSEESLEALLKKASPNSVRPPKGNPIQENST